MLKIKICPCLGRAVDSLLHASSVVRMNSLQYQLQCRLNRSIVFKDIVGFLRPVDFSAEDAPAEAAGVAQPLRFSQIGLAASQIGGSFRHLHLEFVAGFTGFRHLRIIRSKNSPLGHRVRESCALRYERVCRGLTARAASTSAASDNSRSSR